MFILKYLQLPYQFDAARILKELNSLASSYWRLHYQKLHYEGNWSAIPLRSTGGDVTNIIVAPTDITPYADTVLLKNAPYCQEILETFQCPLSGVRFLKLDAGSKIKEHRDAELYYEKGEIRIHIPVVTNDDVEFYLDKERILLQEGECWYINFNLPHSISNNSTEDRIHLVIDAKVNDWVREIFSDDTLRRKDIEEQGPDAKTKMEIVRNLRQMNTETSNRLADEMELIIPKTMLP